MKLRLSGACAGIIALSYWCCNPMVSHNLPDHSPEKLNDGIAIGTLSEVGIDSAALFNLSTQIDTGFYPNIHSLLIYKKNKLVFEQYYPGKDQNWGEDLGVINHRIQDLHDVRSISKSIVSACIGIAIEQQKIKGVDARVFDYFKEHAALDTGLKKGLTIKHLLSMTAGLLWNEEVPYDNPENSEIQMSNSADPIQFILSRPSTAPPGKQWKYNGGTTHLLSVILEKSTGQQVDDFARDYLFKPLGIDSFSWTRIPGMDQPAAASGLRLRSRDLLKFGILFHQGGKWLDQQVVPNQWVVDSFKPQIQLGPDGTEYGYQFWIFNETYKGKPISIVAAVGNGDQRIFFDEANDLLTVITAGNYNLRNIKNNSAAIFRKIHDALLSNN